jgi:DNA-binding transcriptional LysR family regulator
MDRLAAISAFVGVAEQGGFASAARRMRVNPSAVTRAVQALEAELGVQLFMRSTRSVRLTDAGTRYLAHARRILGELDVAERDMRDTQAVPSGRITVTAPVQFGRLHVRPAVSRFLARHPEVSVRLRLDDAISSLVEEGIDLAVRIGRLADSSLVARRVGWTRRLLVASPTYLDRRGMPETPEALLGHDIAGVASDTGHTEWRVGDVTLRLRPRFTSDSIDAVVGHVLDGGGIAFLLSYQTAASIASGRLVELLPDHAPDRVPIHLVHPPARLPRLATRALIDMVVGEARWDFSQR